MQSKLIYVIFAIVVLIAGVLIAISLAPPVANSGGIPHPDIPGMQAGGDGGPSPRCDRLVDNRGRKR